MDRGGIDVDAVPVRDQVSSGGEVAVRPVRTHSVHEIILRASYVASSDTRICLLEFLSLLERSLESDSFPPIFPYSCVYIYIYIYIYLSTRLYLSHWPS